MSQPWENPVLSGAKAKLSSGRQTLGRVSASLLSVQSQVDHTERTLLGRILDLQTAQTFFMRHDDILQANGQLEEEVSTLNAQIARLSSALHEAQKTFFASQDSYLRSESKLQTRVEESEATIESLTEELNKEASVRTARTRLAQVHKELLAEATSSTEHLLSLRQEIKIVQTSDRVEECKHLELRKNLVTFHNYNAGCRAVVHNATEILHSVKVADVRNSEVFALHRDVHPNAVVATEQRLSATRAALISEVRKTEAAELNSMAELKDRREDLQKLETTMSSDLETLQAEIDAEKERMIALSASLKENSEAEAQALSRKRDMDAKISRLTIEVAGQDHKLKEALALDAQNVALQRELQDASAQLQAAKEAEERSRLSLELAKAEMSKEESVLGLAKQTLTKSRQEGKITLKEVEQQSVARSMAILKSGEAVIAKQCKSRWDEIWKSKRTQLVKCKVLRERLSFERARIDAPKHSLAALTR